MTHPFRFVLALAALLPPSLALAQAPTRVETYKQVAGSPLAAHVFSPGTRNGPAPAVLIFHGGGWEAGEPEWVHAAAGQFQAAGLVAIAIQYRLAGAAVTPADAVRDACDAFVWARAHAAALGIDPRRVAGYGVSAGGHLVAAAGLGACPAGARPDLMALWSPAVDLEHDGWFVKLMKGGDVRAISPLVLANHRGPPTVIVQGENDTLTPLAGARALCAALIAAGGTCELNVYPGLGHLLSRNLENQESDFDIDRDADRDGDAKIAAFFRANGFAAP